MRRAKRDDGGSFSKGGPLRTSQDSVLRRWFRRPKRAPGRSIAVLPFKNMSADPENEYFSDGLSESIINTLARIRDFKVVARTSAFAFKGRDVDIREVGKRLSVGHVLEGSVQKSADRVRITAQLIDVADGFHLWSERYDRSLKDVFAIQDEISLAIVDRLKIHPLEEERKRIVKHQTEDAEAFNLYLKGRYFYNKRTEEDLERSIQNYRAAIARDPGFALPYAGLADSYSTLGLYHWLPVNKAKAKAKEAALKALKIDDTIGETHAAYANVVLWFDWQWATAEEEYKKALKLSPSDVEARHMYAHLMESESRLDEALSEMERALELEPLSINLNACLANVLFFARRYDEAVERLRKTIEMDPGFPLQYFYLGRAYLQKGMNEEAVAMFTRGTEFPTISSIALCGLGYAHAVSGRLDEVRQILHRLDGLSEKGQINSYYTAFLYAGLNDKDRVLDYLEKAYEEGDMYLFYLKVDPAFDTWRSDPRFLELMKKTGLAGRPASDAAAPMDSQDALIKTSTGIEFGLGKMVAHYRLLDKIGEGGMGVVYKAEDTKLRRAVALKFLPPDMIRDKTAAARFLREAQTAAALDHPNICTIFEINEEDGQTYISMAYIKGQSLKERIAQGPLELEEAQGIALQVAEGLRAAHARGVIHRDIKPANIMLTPEGKAKIMDFGLAKFERGVDVTRTMAVMGTIAYMSPEQARGDAVDQRTDIWSFGSVLYEMFSGKLPFGKRPEQLLYFAILNEQPESLSSAQPDIPRAVERIVMKCLEKEPGRRYQNMNDLLSDLRTARSSAKAAVPAPKKSIIVLPFENISSDPEQEYFCDGMTEEIITDLSHIHDLLVISRNSAMTFKGTKKKTREIAREVSVQYVLEGSVRKAGNSLRITAQLIDAETDAHLWAERYSGILDDVFDIQEKVSRSIAGALKMKLTSDENHRIASNPISNVYAYECFLKARYELWKWTEEGLDKALDHLEKGLEISGENAVLVAGMGYVYFQYINNGFKTDDLTLKKAEEYTKRALKLDPESPAGQIVLALLQGWSGQSQEAVTRFKKVLGIEPNNFDALVWFPCFCAYLGKTGAVYPYVDRLLAVEPFHPMTHFTAWLVKVMNGEFAAALNSMGRTYGSFPKDPLIQWGYAQTLLYCGLENEARPVIDKLGQTAPDFLFGRIACSLALGLRRKKRQALEILKDPKIEYLARRDFGYSYYVAEAYAAADEKKEAMDWLEHALDLGFLNFPFLNELNPLLENIRSEPRFKTLIERVKREWENFEV